MISVIPEYISRVDGSTVQALKIRSILLDPNTGRMVLRFHDRRFPEMITCAKTYKVPAPGSWLVKGEDAVIRFLSELEFLTEFRPG